MRSPVLFNRLDLFEGIIDTMDCISKGDKNLNHTACVIRKVANRINVIDGTVIEIEPDNAKTLYNFLNKMAEKFNPLYDTSNVTVVESMVMYWVLSRYTNIDFGSLRKYLVGSEENLEVCVNYIKEMEDVNGFSISGIVEDLYMSKDVDSLLDRFREAVKCCLNYGLATLNYAPEVINNLNDKYNVVEYIQNCPDLAFPRGYMCMINPLVRINMCLEDGSYYEDGMSYIIKDGFELGCVTDDNDDSAGDFVGMLRDWMIVILAHAAKMYKGKIEKNKK